MQIDVITLFPAMFDGLRDNGISRVALESGAASLACYNPRDFTDDAYHTVDGRPYGGGPGMVMLPGPLDRSIDAIRESNAGPLIYLSPQGEKLTQDLVQELSEIPAMVLLCGRYEGVDERILAAHMDREISIGDYVLAGGELAAMVLIESMLRLMPGVLGNSASAEQDSFSDGLLDCPHYTRPEVYRGRAVPAVLLSGNHADISRWRLAQSLTRTRTRRPDVFGQRVLDQHEKAVLEEFDLEYKKDDQRD